MKTNLFAFLFLVLLVSCAESQIRESDWIEKENENRLLTIKKENDKYWINQFDTTLEILEPHSNPYVQFRDRKMPITFSEDGSSLYFISSEYISLNKSTKGQFIGAWKSLDDDTRFIVQMDSNIELNWDIIKDSGKPVRFYPKRIENGVHFTLGQDTLSFKIKDGYIIDKNGTKYSREKG